MTERSAQIEQCIQECECICESIEELAQVQVQVASRSVGLFGSSSDSDSSESGTENDDQDENDVVETVTESYGDVTEPQLEKYYTMVITSDRSEEEKNFLSSPIRLFLQISLHDSSLIDKQRL